MVVLFIYSEFTNKADRDGTCAYYFILQNPHVEHPQGKPRLGEITQQYIYLAWCYYLSKRNKLLLSSQVLTSHD